MSTADAEQLWYLGAVLIGALIAQGCLAISHAIEMRRLNRERRLREAQRQLREKRLASLPPIRVGLLRLYATDDGRLETSWGERTHL